MKLIHAAFAVVAASLLPTATADEPQTSNLDGARAWTISVSADVAPVSHGDLAYPTRAATLGEAGYCDVSYDVTAGGDVSDVRVLRCSSASFEREAVRATECMVFGTGEARDNAQLRIRWAIAADTPGLRTASLN